MKFEGQNQDPGVTPMQGRVVFHQERLFRSAGGSDMLAHTRYLRLAWANDLPAKIGEMDYSQCVLALRLIEHACREQGMHNFRDVRTYWEQLQ